MNSLASRIHAPVWLWYACLFKSFCHRLIPRIYIQFSKMLGSLALALGLSEKSHDETALVGDRMVDVVLPPMDRGNTVLGIGPVCGSNHTVNLYPQVLGVFSLNTESDSE